MSPTVHSNWCQCSKTSSMKIASRLAASISECLVIPWHDSQKLLAKPSERASCKSCETSLNVNSSSLAILVKSILKSTQGLLENTLVECWRSLFETLQPAICSTRPRRTADWTRMIRLLLALVWKYLLVLEDFHLDDSHHLILPAHD